MHSHLSAAQIDEVAQREGIKWLRSK